MFFSLRLCPLSFVQGITRRKSTSNFTVQVSGKFVCKRLLERASARFACALLRLATRRNVSISSGSRNMESTIPKNYTERIAEHQENLVKLRMRTQWDDGQANRGE